MTHAMARSKKKRRSVENKKKEVVLGMRRHFSGATEKIVYVA
jgi:hypothetical protein